MACLHLISSEDALAECLEIAAAEDSLLLLGRAAAAADTDIGRQLLVLSEDVPGGVSPADSVTLIDYEAFVELTVRHQPIVTWR